MPKNGVRISVPLSASCSGLYSVALSQVKGPRKCGTTFSFGGSVDHDDAKLEQRTLALSGEVL